MAALRDRRARRAPPVSREFVFHGATLMGAGTFLLAIGALGEALRQWGVAWAAAALLAAGLMALALALSAASPARPAATAARPPLLPRPP
jgi:small-conductance mechanosensitive channel